MLRTRALLGHPGRFALTYTLGWTTQQNLRWFGVRIVRICCPRNIVALVGTFFLARSPSFGALQLKGKSPVIFGSS